MSDRTTPADDLVLRLANLDARRSAAADAPTDRDLRPAAEHRGAPDMATLANPTIWLFIVTLALWAFGTAGLLAGLIPWWVALISNAIGAYLGFTVFHDSVHRAAHRNRRVNDLIGVLPAWMLGFTYPLFRICHLKHHAHTNDPAHDPDHWVSHVRWWNAPVVLIHTSHIYRRLAFRHGWVTTRQKWTQIGFDAATIGLLVASIIGGFWAEYLILFLGPQLLAGLVLFFAFDYLPHYPFDSTERFYDTRIQPGRLRHALLLGQNYHLIHHLWVSVPWFKYRQVFHELEPELRAKDVRIDG